MLSQRTATLQENLKCIFLEMLRFRSLHGFNIKDMKNWRKLGDRASPEAPEWVSLGRLPHLPPSTVGYKEPWEAHSISKFGEGEGLKREEGFLHSWKLWL